MSLLNSLASAAMNAATGQGQNSGGLDAQAMMHMASQLLEQSGGLQGLVGKLQSGGLADVVSSWVGTGANQAVSGEQLQQALGGDLLGQLAQHFGGNAQAAAGGLADVLPGLIDKLTPDGQLPADGGANALQGLLGGQAGDLVGMLGGLLKR
jgi:uncharacterized protein YidB (DUF937 family)